ncbi:MAG: MopE-related protein, partial [Flavobacteriales bacterium]|nr:MopE-related protein [Flavobacteriales bacterium]
GHVANNQDCNDANAAINPLAAEVCNGVDDDCDNLVDEGVLGTWYADADGDTYGNPTNFITSCTPPSGYVSNAGDCNDANPAVYSGATEVCNGVDDDCDNLVDEGVLATWYADNDGDGYGNPAVSAQACVAPSGYVGNNQDCDDNNPNINPATVWYQDADGDNYGNPSISQFSCIQPSGFVSNTGDCNDNNPAIHSGATEICGNGADDDCDGQTDESCLAVTQLLPANCGITVNAMAQPLRAFVMPLAQQYEFEVTDGVNNWSLVRNVRGFYLGMLSGIQYGTTYQVRVRWNDGNQWSPWGPWCSVNTPSTPPLLMADSLSCNATALSFWHIVRAVTLPVNYIAPYEVYGATQYHFELTHGSDTIHYYRPVRGFVLGEVPGLKYGTTYNIRIRSLVFGQWSNWGPSCSISTPAWPAQTQLVNCNTTVGDLVTWIPFERVYGATQYEIWLYNANYNDTITRPQPNYPQNQRFRLNLFSPIPGPGMYNVRIRAFVPGQGWTGWGPMCQVVYGSYLTEPAEEPEPDMWKVKAFPVPFDGEVYLTVETWSDEPLRITVLDINGRMIESRQVQMEHNGLLTLGQDWAAGVYAIRVEQGPQVRTLRVVKASQ